MGGRVVQWPGVRCRTVVGGGRSWVSDGCGGRLGGDWLDGGRWAGGAGRGYPGATTVRVPRGWRWLAADSPIPPDAPERPVAGVRSPVRGCKSRFSADFVPESRHTPANRDDRRRAGQLQRAERPPGPASACRCRARRAAIGELSTGISTFRSPRRDRTGHAADSEAVLTRLPSHLIDLLSERSGPITSAQLAAVGFDRHRTGRWVHRGLLLPLADGVFTAAGVRELVDDWTWFALRSKAFLIASAPDAFAGSWSAVALHDLPAVGPPPPLPCIIRTGRPPRGTERTGNGWTRFATVPPDLCDTVCGLPVLSAPGAVIDIGRRASRLSTLVVADAVALRAGSTRAMGVALERLERWPWTLRSRWAVEHADPDCESPLETIGRFAIIQAGLPTPRSNVWLGLDGPAVSGRPLLGGPAARAGG